MVAHRADALVDYYKMCWMRMLMFPSAEVNHFHFDLFSSGQCWSSGSCACLDSCGTVDEHAVKTFFCQVKSNNKLNARLKLILLSLSLFLIASSNLWLLLVDMQVSELCDLLINWLLDYFNKLCLYNWQPIWKKRKWTLIYDIKNSILDGLNINILQKGNRQFIRKPKK